MATHFNNKAEYKAEWKRRKTAAKTAQKKANEAFSAYISAKRLAKPAEEVKKLEEVFNLASEEARAVTGSMNEIKFGKKNADGSVDAGHEYSPLNDGTRNSKPGEKSKGSDDLGGESDNEDLESEQSTSSESSSESDSKAPEPDSNNKEQREKTSKGLGLQFSKGFYDTLSRKAKGQIQGNTLDAKATTAKEQAQNFRNEAGNRQMEAQRAQQIANQNPYAEAGKVASVQNDAENRQRVQKAGVLGAGAALLRSTNTPDVQSQMQREDTQAQVAAQQREKGDEDQRKSIGQEGLNAQYKMYSRDQNDDVNTEDRLSKGVGAGEETVTNETTTEATEESTTPAEQTEQPAQQPEPQQPSMPSGNPQHVINALLGSSKGQDLRSGQEGAADKELYDWAISQGVTPIQAGQHKNENDVNSWEQEFIANNGESGQSVMQQLRQGRAGEGNDASRNFNTDEMDQMNKSMTVQNNTPSDVRIKNIEGELSDMRMKWIKEDWDRDGKISQRDFDYLVSKVGPFQHEGRSYDLYNEDDWADDTDQTILKLYGDHIKNYLYTYKPEATRIDPSIDLEQEHIGPMAQDIEQVNPACIKETPEGVKTVDTQRLAMMNAGAIGELARMLESIDNRLSKLGV